MDDPPPRSSFRKIRRTMRLGGLVVLAIVALIAVTLGGFAAGWKTWHPSKIDPPATTSSGPSGKAPSSSFPSPIHQPSISPSAGGPNGNQSLLDTSRGPQLEALLADARVALRYARSDDLGLAQAHHLLGEIEESALPDALRHAAALPATESRRQIIGALLRHWARAAPVAAFDALEQTFAGPDFFDHLETVMSPWAAEDPVAAYRAYTESVRPRADSHRDSAAPFNLRRIFQFWSRDHFDAALSEFRTLRGEEAGYALRGIASTAGEHLEDLRFLDPLLTLSADHQETAFSQIARNVSRRDGPASAITWLEGIPVEPAIRTEIESDLAGDWARKAPDTAAEWALSRNREDGATEPLREVIRRWAEWQPNVAGRWLHQLEPGTEPADVAFAAFAVEITSKDPESALAWAGEIRAPEARRKTLENIGRQFGYRYTPNARAAIAASPLSDAEKTALLDSLESARP